MATTTLTARAKAEAALATGFTTKAGQKDALDNVTRAYEAAKGILSKACLDARTVATDTRADGTPFDYYEMSDAVSAVYWDVPSYPHQFKAKHAQLVRAAFGDRFEAELAEMADLAALRDTIKAAPITAVPSKAEVARKEAAAILAPVSANVVAAAVAPLKGDAVERAAKEALEIVAEVEAALAAAGWDLDVAAPRGNSLKDGRERYRAKNAKRQLFAAVTKATADYRRQGEPHIVAMNADGIARFVEATRYDAGVQYDAFTAKLATKVGAVTEAKLSGNHVWGYSVLTVTTEAGAVEHWRTQQIINRSVYGKLFHQWPTRRA